MEQTHISRIAAELTVREHQVSAVAGLLSEGATIPFIARYRKEATGSLDEVVVTAIRDRLKQLEELATRKAAVLKSLEEQGKLSDDLKAAVATAETMATLEDIYLPYKPKRRTKGMIAREKGLEPLAALIFAQEGCVPETEAAAFVSPDREVPSIAEALAGARDIIAEWINEDADARASLRALFLEKGVIESRGAPDKEEIGAKYRDYFNWTEGAKSAPSHRILAMRRGEREDFLNLSMLPPEEEAIGLLTARFVKGPGEDSRQVALAAQDCYKRLLSRSMETELRLSTKERADLDAIQVFADNLRQLLLASPLGAKRVMGIDPGFRTGCKVVCLDRQGKLLVNDTVYLHMSEKKDQEGREKLLELCRKFDIEAIAVGNGTAGRETESLVKSLPLPSSIQVVMVNESGASIYSASEIAREEFPNHDVTVRGSVSIGRRLMDPLSELVKLDPKSIGVGQYQHDVDQTALKQSLDDVVISCVNSVGVDVNRASAPLLTYVSGLGPQLAKNIVVFRDENGPFPSREALKNVPRLGPKAFEQSAGFLRVTGSPDAHPLDASAVHPESYHVVDAMARDLGCEIQALMASSSLREKVDLSRYITDAVGLPTLTDIMKELAKPGRDPRENFELFEFAKGVEKIEDLTPGLSLPGIVTNVTAFGAFVDIGVHQDGLVHISELADRFVKDPAEVVQVQQKVKVTVLEVDLARKRIALSMRSSPGAPVQREEKAAPKPGSKPGSKPGTKPGSKPGKSAPPKKEVQNTPFNNPFADLLKLRK